MNLEAAIKAKDVERVRQLLASGADPNATDEWREPVLILAIRWEQAEIAELLISAGADVNVVNQSDNGSTPLHFAAGATMLAPSVAIAKLLLAKGARVDATTGAGNTPLMWVAQSKKESALDVAGLLIAHGASLDRRGEDGPAIQYARDSGTREMVQFLQNASTRAERKSSAPAANRQLVSLGIAVFVVIVGVIIYRSSHSNAPSASKKAVLPDVRSLNDFGSHNTQNASKPSSQLPLPRRRPQGIVGIISAVDHDRKTFTVISRTATRVFKVIQKTKILRDGKPATMSDIIENEKANGLAVEDADGSFETIILELGDPRKSPYRSQRPR